MWSSNPTGVAADYQQLVYEMIKALGAVRAGIASRRCGGGVSDGSFRGGSCGTRCGSRIRKMTITTPSTVFFCPPLDKRYRPPCGSPETGCRSGLPPCWLLAAPPAVEKSNVATLSSRQAFRAVAPCRPRHAAAEYETGVSGDAGEALARQKRPSRMRSIRACWRFRLRRTPEWVGGTPYGVIVMDALDRHAATLAKRWTEAPAESATSNSLFVRSGTQRCCGRRRTGSKKTIPLSGNQR